MTMTQEQQSAIRDALRQTNVWKSYELNMMAGTSSVLITSLLAVRTCFRLMLKSERMLWSGLWLIGAGTGWLLGKKREPIPAYASLLGVGVELVSFVMLLCSAGLSLIWMLLCALLMGLGTGLTMLAMRGMSLNIRPILRFLLPDSSDEMREESLRLANIRTTGMALVLALLLGTVLCLSPVPALCGVCAAAMLLVAALNDPLDKRIAGMVKRYLSSTEDNPALKKYLDSMLVEKRRQPWLIRMLLFLLRVGYRYRLQGEENIHTDVENPTIYLCNHGNIYGPLACILHIPTHVRPWVISNILVDREETAGYVYRYNFGPAKWLPGPLKWPVSHLVARLSNWCMGRCIEGVPVFRDHPRQLMNTFRGAVDVMRCGDDMLIFPENPNAVAQDHGYEATGVGTLFSGFAMLAPIYYSRTGKKCRFLPMCAHKGNRTLTFGTEVVYNPDNAPIDERDRLVTEIERQMRAMYEHEDAIYQAKHRH